MRWMKSITRIPNQMHTHLHQVSQRARQNIDLLKVMFCIHQMLKTSHSMIICHVMFLRSPTCLQASYEQGKLRLLPTFGHLLKVPQRKQ